jgi:hypothetical protein
VDSKVVPGLERAEFSTVVESDVPVAIERTMSWDATGYGAHAETGVDAPSLIWYLAEGATHSRFSLFYLVENPGTATALVDVTYLLPSPQSALTRPYTVGPASRLTIWVDTEDARLANTDVSAVIRSVNGVPVVVERAMYLDSDGVTFAAGHAAAAVTAPSFTYYFAEGATGPYFDTFLLVANPLDLAADVIVRYLLPDATWLEKTYRVPGASRYTIWVDGEDPRLRDTALAFEVQVTNGVPVVVERSMWWPGRPGGPWEEGHVTAGATAPATTWTLADGIVGGPADAATYFLIANVSSESLGGAAVTLVFDDGTTVSKTFALGPSMRLAISVGDEFPASTGREFGAIVQAISLRPSHLEPPSLPQLVVERSIYWDARGTFWAAGTNALGER